MTKWIIIAEEIRRKWKSIDMNFDEKYPVRFSYAFFCNQKWLKIQIVFIMLHHLQWQWAWKQSSCKNGGKLLKIANYYISSMIS
ncbi:unnamed protein product [Blepharisma stoltei]|uniref:Uncharacterized protein n=1 Tax=Blepharisma stoltei TaxID=1481888 RepID=A0AAU9K0R2_9CILI|nr:unnamed protein product [Blepharisma stoltei]